MRDLTVLSTACGAMFMPGFFRCLKENQERNIKIVGVDCENNPVMKLFVDIFYCVPRYTSKEYVDVLLEICRKEKVDVFFPQISMELSIIAKRIDEFEALGVYVALTNIDTLQVANNKLKLYEAMEKAGIQTPEFYKVSSSEELILNAKKLGYPDKPVCLKLTESSGSRGVRIIKEDISKVDLFVSQKPTSMYITMDEMCSILDEMKICPDMMIMEYLPGCEYTVDLLAEHGKVLYMAGRRNIVSSASIAMDSIVEKKERAYEICTEIVRLLGLDGNVGFDFMLDEEDEPYLTDLNPRVTATIVLFLAAGINFPYLRIKQLLGEKLPALTIKYNTRLVRKYADILIAENEVEN